MNDIPFWASTSVIFEPSETVSSIDSIFEWIFALGLGRKVYLRRTALRELVKKDIAALNLTETAERIVFVDEWPDAFFHCDLLHTVVVGLGDDLSGLAARIGLPLLNTPLLPENWREPQAQNLSGDCIAIVGPESTGKSTLAADLASQFGLILVEEYIRLLLQFRETTVTTLQDVELVCRAQAAYETAALLGARGGILCDGEPRQTLVWSDILFLARPQGLDAWAHQRSYKGYLITTPDIAWHRDPQRCLPEGRADFFERVSREVRATGKPCAVISGEGQARKMNAQKALKSLKL